MSNQLSTKPKQATVVPDSVADHAGLLSGDQIIAVDGHIAEGESWIDDTLLPIVRKGGLLSFAVERSDGTTLVEARTIKACSYPVELDFDDDITAKFDGVAISVTTGTMRFVASDDEVAFAIAHEMAHIQLGLFGGYQSDEFVADQRRVSDGTSRFRCPPCRSLFSALGCRGSRIHPT